ncbi:MAG: InlB B-repeat-containing protein [Bacilli bacterium]|nr:InlB B-repeat-containing protein [Bacilli bacterium]
MKSKMLTRILGAFAAFSMAAGVGVAIGVAAVKEAAPVHAAAGDEVVYKEVTFSSSTMGSSVSGYTSTWTNTTTGDTGIAVSLTNFNNNGKGWDYVKCGRKNNASVGTITTSAAIDEAITKVDVTIDAITASKVNSIKLYTSPNGSSWSSVGTYTAATGTKSVALTTPTQNLYYKVEFDCASGSSNGLVTVSKLEYYYIEPSSETYTVSFNANGGSGSMSDVSDVKGSYILPDNGFTAPANKAFAGWKANNAGDLIAAGDSYTVSANVTFYAQWVDAYTVTYTAGTNGSGSYAHATQPAGSYTLLDFASLTGVSANSGYRFVNYTVNGVDKDPGDVITLSASTSVVVNFEVKPLDTTYDFATNFSTYASTWNTTYGSKTLAGTTDVGGNYSATIVLGRANKQASGTIPTLAAAKNTTVDNMIVFTLTETGYKIKDVTVTFTQRSSNKPTLNLFKGSDTTASGITALDTATIGTKSTLSVASLNDTSFSVNCIASGTSNNCSVDLSSIYISIEAQAAYGTTDHIKVTGMPRTVYHIGEVYDSTGLAVTAYDGADESIANFKDVTSSITTRFRSGVYTFDDTDVPSTDMWIEYKEGDSTYSTAEDITIYVYALAEYQLVESAPADWSGNYLIVATDSDSNLVAMNGGLANPDVEGGYQVVTEKSTGIIEAGQENEWTIASYSNGYSIQGKSGKYIGRGTDSNGMDVSDSALLNTLAFADGEVTVSGSSTGRKLSFSATGNRFRYYSSGAVKLYKLVESSNAAAYAAQFLNDLGSICDANGNSDVDDLSFTWACLAIDFGELSATDKELFRTGVASASGTDIQKTLALYDYVAAKYNTRLESEDCENYDFMGREPQPLAQGRIVSIIESSEDKTMIGVIGALTIATIAAFSVITLKKRKSI